MKKSLLISFLLIVNMAFIYAGPAQCVDPNFTTNKSVTQLIGNTNCKNTKVNCSNAAYFNLKTPEVQNKVSFRTVTDAAISITVADITSLIQPGMTQTSSTSSNSFSMDIGKPNNMTAQTWTLPSITYTGSNSIDFIATSAVPASAFVTGATHVARKKLSSALTAYSFYQLNSGELDEMGETFEDKTDPMHITYPNFSESAMDFTNAPLVLGANFTSHAVNYDTDAAYPKTVSSSSVIVDAFGTITVGATAYPCLRMHLTETKTVYSSSSSATTQTKNYIAWVTESGFRIYGEISAGELATNLDASITNANVTLSNFKSYSYSPTSTTPVELLSFEGKAAIGGADLTWTTASEQNNRFFDIEKSTDGQNFEKIGRVNGAGTTSQQQTYTFRDENLALLSYYRLRQIDIDGTSTTSNVISVAAETQNIASLHAFPNPTKNSITLSTSDYSQPSRLFNITGALIFNSDKTPLQINLSDMTSGIYFLQVGSEVIKVVKD